MRRPDPYGLLARHYDAVMVDHARLFRRARRGLLRDILPGVRSLCDLGCGSGETALAFARRGRRVHALDLSPAQIRTLRAKARREGVAVRARVGDMRDFRLPEAVDLVLSEFDAVNHLPRHADLRRVARAAARALRPGGWFVFDVNTRKAFERLWAGTSWSEGPGFTLAQVGSFDRRRRRAVLRHEWFLRRGRTWIRRVETTTEVCWSVAEIRAALRAAGFKPVQVRDGAEFFSGWDWEEPGCRLFFLARLGAPNQGAGMARARTGAGIAAAAR